MSLVSRPGQYTIGVFIGGKAGVQVGPFQEAVYRMDLQNDTRYRIVYIDILLRCELFNLVLLL